MSGSVTDWVAKYVNTRSCKGFYVWVKLFFSRLGHKGTAFLRDKYEIQENQGPLLLPSLHFGGQPTRCRSTNNQESVGVVYLTERDLFYRGRPILPRETHLVKGN